MISRITNRYIIGAVKFLAMGDNNHRFCFHIHFQHVMPCKIGHKQIPGFVEARRYIAHDASPKYLSLYSTKTFEVLDSAVYRAALANQTAWSKANIARFQNMIRSVARITLSRGQGRGAALGIPPR